MEAIPNQYIPILKLKTAEKDALAALPLSLRKQVTPLLQVVEYLPDLPPPAHEGVVATGRVLKSQQSLLQDFGDVLDVRSLDDHVAAAFKGLRQALLSDQLVFLDAGELADDYPTGASLVFKFARMNGLQFIPVTGLLRPAHDHSAVLEVAPGRGAALRVEVYRYPTDDWPADVEKWLAASKLAASSVDLILDLGDIGGIVPAAVEDRALDVVKHAPRATEWRRFALAATSFPGSVANSFLRADETRAVPRLEWETWRALFNARTSLPRFPTFADYGVQHPKGVERRPGGFVRVPPVIRYATPGEWILAKGESGDDASPVAEYKKLAGWFVQGRLRERYYGIHHCAGCAGLAACFRGRKGYGGARKWRTIGTLHHINVVSEALANMPSP